MDAESNGPRWSDANEPADGHVAEYCREIESYLCRKNDGHLIRVVGPSFDLVSSWARDGVPLKVAFGGIDRYFERYYRKVPRRRPVRIDFCEADVRDVFDEWRRATGLTAVSSQGDAEPVHKRGPSLPEHLERVVLKLTNARATGVVGVDLEGLIDQLSSELDLARASGGGVRGEARRAMMERLTAADATMLTIARAAVSADELLAIRHDIEVSLGSALDNMEADAKARARERAVDQLIRERLHLPIIRFS